MKKFLFIVVATLSLFSITPTVEAAHYSDGPYLSFDVGGYTRRIEENCPTPPNCLDPITGLPTSKFYGNADSTRLLAKLGIRANFLDAYVTLGGASLRIDEFDGFYGKMAPAFGGGFKIYMYQSPTYEHFTLFVNPDYLYFKTSDTITFQSQSLGLVTEDHDISWNELFLRIGGSARYDMVEPYGGIELSRVWGQETGPVWGSSDINERDNFGLFLGANIYFDPSGRAAFFGEIGGGDTAYLKVGIKSMF